MTDASGGRPPLNPPPPERGGRGLPGVDFNFGRAEPDPKEVSFLHRGDDVDQGDGAHHHTLGFKRGQAARGSDLLQLTAAFGEASSRLDQLYYGGSLGPSDDLDVFVLPGQWHQETDGSATLALHYPLAGRAGLLIVESSTSDVDFVTQTFVGRPAQDGVPYARVFKRAKYNVAAWGPWIEVTRPPGGLPGMIPTSLAYAGGAAPTVATDGAVSFAGKTSISLNGVFDTSCSAYQILFLGSNSVDNYIHMRMRTGGVDSTGGIYNYQSIYASNWNTGPSMSGGTGLSAWYFTFNNSSSLAHVVGYIFNPAASSATSFQHLQQARSSNQVFGLLQQDIGVGTAYDGFTLYPASGTLSGKVKVVKLW